MEAKKPFLGAGTLGGGVAILVALASGAAWAGSGQAEDSRATAVEVALAQATSSPSPATDSEARVTTIIDLEREVTPYFFDVNKFRAEKSSAAVRIPGLKISAWLGGFAQLDMIWDADRIASRDSFVVSTIPVGATAGPTGASFSARQSRFFIQTESPLPLEMGPLVTHIEVDFFDPANDDTFHIRHAFGEIGRNGRLRFIGGQTFSAFMDATLFPNVLDFEGPVGLVYIRQPQARLMIPVATMLDWTIAIEAPSPGVTANVSGTPYSKYPDLTMQLRWSDSWGHLQLAGVVRQIAFAPDNGSKQRTAGYGGNLAGAINLFEGDQLLWQVAGGTGISKYFTDTGSLNLDAIFLNGSLDSVGGLGIEAFYQHKWTKDTFASTAGYSICHLYDLENGSSDTYKRGQYVAANFLWTPSKRILAGVEYLFGVRSNKNNAHSFDNRVQVSTQFKY